MATKTNAVSEHFKYLMGQDPDQRAKWEGEFSSLLSALATAHQTTDPDCNPLPKFAKSVRGGFNSRLCPYIQHITIDALAKEDWPHRIAENSVYITLSVDLIEKKFEVSHSGAVYLNRAEMRTSNYAMAGLRRIAEAHGLKWLRKSKYKDPKDFATKVVKFWESLMAVVDEQTGGYPYSRLRDDAKPVYMAV